MNTFTTAIALAALLRLPLPAASLASPEFLTHTTVRVEDAAAESLIEYERDFQRRMEGERILATARQFIGVPYVFGGTSPYGFDCSGFTMETFAKHGIQLPRCADDQFYQGKPVRELIPGDLVFFTTYLPGPSHVGIYVGHDKFIHASCSHGVTISSLKEDYYATRYLGARSYL